MKRRFLLVMFLCLAVFSCGIFESKKFANVIMVDGPMNESGEATFSYTGTVRNVGDGKALYVRVYITIYNPGNIALAQSFHLVDKTDLSPGESSAWRVTFEDEDYEIRDLMDESRTSYDITWNDED